MDPDSILLDRVFQPLVDAVSAWTTCFGLARGALVIAVEAQAMMLFWDMVGLPSTFNLMFTGTAVLLTAFGARQAWTMIVRAERQARAGAMNVRRMTLRGQRVTWLGVCILCSTMLLVSTPDVRAAAGTLGCLAWVALIYFVSCEKRPPVFRRATAPMSATAGAG